jgi:hypothetical protein
MRTGACHFQCALTEGDCAFLYFTHHAESGLRVDKKSDAATLQNRRSWG